MRVSGGSLDSLAVGVSESIDGWQIILLLLQNEYSMKTLKSNENRVPCEEARAYSVIAQVTARVRVSGMPFGIQTPRLKIHPSSQQRRINQVKIQNKNNHLTLPIDVRVDVVPRPTCEDATT